MNQYHTETVKLSFVLFDEIEKASDALWNLLLGILDKATLTLGDNRKVDFSQAMIFMTSNLGAAEMSNLVSPKLGFNGCYVAPEPAKTDEKLNEKLSRSGIEAARRKFTPEFMNRIDKCVVFKTLGETELRRILDLELAQVQQRVFSSPSEKPFVLTVSASGKDFLLSQGTDLKYGARHLKRAIERLLVHPLSNLIATNQVATGDWIKADFDSGRSCLLFTTEEENLSLNTMFGMIGDESPIPAAMAAASGAVAPLKTASAKPGKK